MNINYLSQLPKWFLVSVVLVAGLIFIVILSPPHTVCSSQYEILENQLNGILFPKKEKKIKRKPLLDLYIERCKTTNSPGGCYELFNSQRKLLNELRKVSNECTSFIGKIKEVKRSLFESTELLIQIAWGSQPPQSVLDKNGWLDSSEIYLFCELKSTIIQFYGNDKWIELQEKMFKNLPGALKMDRSQVWERMILSNRCELWR